MISLLPVLILKTSGRETHLQWPYVIPSISNHYKFEQTMRFDVSYNDKLEGMVDY